ncbi:MAG: hypothetical protein ACYC9J_00435 [Sulfuricaulis sp.]
MAPADDNDQRARGKKSLQPVEAAGELLPPTPGRIDLRDAHAIRRELAAVYRDMRGGKIEGQDGTRLAYVLDLIRKAYETGTLQEKVETLERALKLRNKNDET